MKIEIHYTAKGTIGLEIGRRRRRRRRVHCKLESLVQGYDKWRETTKQRMKERDFFF